MHPAWIRPASPLRVPLTARCQPAWVRLAGPGRPEPRASYPPGEVAYLPLGRGGDGIAGRQGRRAPLQGSAGVEAAAVTVATTRCSPHVYDALGCAAKAIPVTKNTRGAGLLLHSRRRDESTRSSTTESSSSTLTTASGTSSATGSGRTESKSTSSTTESSTTGTPRACSRPPPCESAADDGAARGPEEGSGDALSDEEATEGSGRGDVEAPTVGSLLHGSGVCKPCAFVHKKGCASGASCQFCHLCSPDEHQRRQQARWDQKKGEWKQFRKERRKELHSQKGRLRAVCTAPAQY